MPNDKDEALTVKKTDATPEETKENASEETPENGETEEKSTSKDIDFESELAKEKERGVPDPVKAKEAFDKRMEKRVEETPEEEDRPLTRKEFDELIARERQTITRETYSERIQDIASELALSDAEKNLIIEIHKNRVWPNNLTLREQLEEAHAIANRKRITSLTSELARALKSKNGVSRNIASAHLDGQEGVAPRMKPDEAAAYKRAGFSFDTKEGLWKKQLPNGKTLYKNPKTKQTFLK